MSTTSDFNLSQSWPKGLKEITASGKFTAVIKRGTEEFKKLKKNENPDIIFKREEGTDADNTMNENLYNSVNALAQKVKKEWKNGEEPVYKLRITDAWDEEMEHTTNSLHYEGRAADMTLWNIKNNSVDTSHLGRLCALATESGFSWVFYENSKHIHVSCKK